jgi:hypothetical protein
MSMPLGIGIVPWNCETEDGQAYAGVVLVHPARKCNLDRERATEALLGASSLILPHRDTQILSILSSEPQ